MGADFSYRDADTFVAAVQRAAAPDTGGALRDATVLIRRLGQAHPDWIEAACLDLSASTHMAIRMALADSLDYIEETDPELAGRLAASLTRDHSPSIRRRMRELGRNENEHQ